MNRRTSQEARDRITARREREDQAPRLSTEFRRIKTLQLEIENGNSKYTWRIIVDRAPALFEIPCPEDGCVDGGHDLTREIGRALRASVTHPEGKPAIGMD